MSVISGVALTFSIKYEKCETTKTDGVHCTC